MNHSKIQRMYKRLSLLTLLTLGLSVSAFASDPITVISNLSSFIFGLIKAVGIILVGWGVVQVGLSIQRPRCVPEKPGISHSGGRCCGIFRAGNPHADWCGVTKMGGSNEPPKEVTLYQRHYYRSSQLCPFRLEREARRGVEPFDHIPTGL